MGHTNDGRKVDFAQGHQLIEPGCSYSYDAVNANEKIIRDFSFHRTGNKKNILRICKLRSYDTASHLSYIFLPFFFASLS